MCLGGTWDHNAILNGSLDEPVFISITVHAIVNTWLAEIKVSLFTDAAMIVFIWNGLPAVIAINAVGGQWEVVQGGQSREAEQISHRSLGHFASGVGACRCMKSTRDRTSRRVGASLLE